jgi:hypothetical protein
MRHVTTETWYSYFRIRDLHLILTWRGWPTVLL